MTPSTNRRVSARRALRRPATVTLPGGVERLVRTWDVGFDGISLVSPKPIPPGTRCSVAPSYPDQPDVLPSNDEFITRFVPPPVAAAMIGTDAVLWPPTSSVTVTLSVKLPAA